MEGIFAELRKGMVFVDIETGNHQSHKGVTSPSQGTWGPEALCSPVCSRPHLVLVTSQFGLCTGIGVPCAFWEWRSRNGELSLINESSPFNNAHHCHGDGHGEHENSRCKSVKTQSCVMFNRQRECHIGNLFV